MLLTEVITFQRPVPTFQEFISFLSNHTKLNIETSFEIDSFKIVNPENDWVVAGSYLDNGIELFRGKCSLNYLDYAAIFTLCKLGGKYDKLDYLPHWAMGKFRGVDANYFFENNNEIAIKTLLKKLESNTFLKVLLEDNILRFKVNESAPKEMKLWLGNQKLKMEIINDDLTLYLPDFEINELFGAMVKVLKESNFSFNIHRVPGQLFNCSFKFWSHYSF